MSFSIYIKVKANAKKSEITSLSEYNNQKLIKLSINQKPIDGKANEEIIKYLSKLLKTAKSNIEIAIGETSTIKLIKIHCLDAVEKLKAIIDQLEC